MPFLGQREAFLPVPSWNISVLFAYSRKNKEGSGSTFPAFTAGEKCEVGANVRKIVILIRSNSTPVLFSDFESNKTFPC